MLDKILEKYGLKFEDLTIDERDTLLEWTNVAQSGQISVDKIRDYIYSMRQHIDDLISKEPPFLRIFIFKVQNPMLIYLQARLRNYLMLERVIVTPEKAKEQLKNMLSNLSGKEVS